MKKYIAGFACVMAVSMTGCSLVGGGAFKKQVKKITETAEDVCDAEEASNKQRKSILKNVSMKNVFEDGLYMTLDEDEISEMKDGLDSIDPDEIKSAFAFMKADPSTDSSIVLMVLEVNDEDMGEDIIDELSKMYGDIDSNLIKQYEDAGYEAAFGCEDDDGYYAAMLYINGEAVDLASGAFVECNKKIITIVIYNGAGQTELLGEFYDLMDDAGLADMEDLLKQKNKPKEK